MTIKSTIYKLLLVSCVLAIAIPTSYGMDGEKAVEKHGGSQLDKFRSRMQGKLQGFRERSTETAKQLEQSSKEVAKLHEGANESLGALEKRFDRMDTMQIELDKRCLALFSKAAQVYKEFMAAIEEASARGEDNIALSFRQVMDLLAELDRKMDEGKEKQIEAFKGMIKEQVDAHQEVITMNKGQAEKLGLLLKEFGLDSCAK